MSFYAVSSEQSRRVKIEKVKIDVDHDTFYMTEGDKPFRMVMITLQNGKVWVQAASPYDGSARASMTCEEFYEEMLALAKKYKGRKA